MDKKNQGFTRRDFLNGSRRWLGGAWLATQWPGILLAAEEAREQMASTPLWSTLRDDEAVALGAIADRIFPPDETPGASDIGVVHFMDRALAGIMQGALRPTREGLRDIEQRAQSLSGGSATFAQLDSGAQDELLTQVEQTMFFRTVHFMTLCGLFTLPSYGGNRERLGWQLLGFEARHAWQPPFGHYDAEYAREASHAG